MSLIRLFLSAASLLLFVGVTAQAQPFGYFSRDDDQGVDDPYASPPPRPQRYVQPRQNQNSGSYFYDGQNVQVQRQQQQRRRNLWAARRYEADPFFGDDEDRPPGEILGDSSTQDPAKSKDPQVYCRGFVRKEVLVDGQKVARYPVTDAKFLQCLPKQPNTPWVVMKDQWSDEDELNWQKFVKSIGQSNCTSLDTCLISSANPYRDQMDLDATQFADCADLPMYLRTYFAYKNKLPMSMVLSYTPAGITPDQQVSIEARRQKAIETDKLEEFEKQIKDIRYSINGNRPTDRYSIPQADGARRTFFQAIDIVHDRVSSGSYRMFRTDSSILPDFYSPSINRNSIKVGTVLYKPTGHLAVVYDVTPDGDVKYVEAHPDNSVNRGTFDREYMQSNPFHGGGFKNWRPFKVIAAKPGPSGEELPPKRNADGSIAAGKLKFMKDEEIPDYSAEQYYGNQPSKDWDWKKGKFIVKGREVNYFDFIRSRLTKGDFQVDPLVRFRKDLSNLCLDLQTRNASVQKALDNQIQNQQHPIALPNNIYGANGDWEAYSTPGRDLLLRSRTVNMIEDTKDYMTKWQSKDPFFSYAGNNLKKDLILIYNEVDAACRITYKDSEGADVRMSLSTALSRLSRMSFDPYLCVERRWGAKSDAELRKCQDNQTKSEWYQNTQFLRNQIVRDPTEVMGYSLDDVKRITQDINAKENPARFNILKALQSL